MQTIFLYLGFFGLAVTLPPLVVIWLYRQDAHPVLEAVSRIRRLPRFAQLLVLAFVVQLIVHGSTKTNGTNYVEGGMTNGPGYVEGGLAGGTYGMPAAGVPVGPLAGPMASPGGEPPTVFGFTTNQFAAGFVMARVAGCCGRGFEPFEGASVVADWLLRGAADDCRQVSAFSPVSETPVVFADGRIHDRVRGASRVYAPLHAALGVVPEANWAMVARTNAQSMVWHGTTPSNTLVVTWRDVLLGRDADSPVSVQAEFFDDGGFDYRYDLESLRWRIEGGELNAADLTNVVIGASLGGEPLVMTLADIADGSSFSLFHSPFSVSFRPLYPEDAVTADRDGDGISTWDELFTYYTDPGLYDSDGDGIGDGDEVAQSFDPLSVSVSNDVLLARLCTFQTNAAYAAAYVAATNELVGYRLWDSFSATWPEGATNLVYERTVRIDRQSGWEQYYLSSCPSAAGGWPWHGACA